MRTSSDVTEARDARAARGRPRSTRAQEAILEATRELLAEGGVRTLTVERVAERAGVAKTTVYRRWRSKHELALAVLIDMVEEMVAVPDLGDTREELVRFVSSAVRILGSTLMGRVMRGLVSDLATDPTLAGEFQARVVARREEEVRRMVGRGVARGDLRPDADAALVHELLFGPVYYRLMLSGRPLDGDLAGQVVDAVLAGLAPADGLA
jgi:AcrR family transcriptional regulator